MVVFDFDKTLTNKDTLWGFYKEVDKGNILFSIKRIFLLFFALLYKAKVINNTLLKRVGVLLFLKGKTQNYLLEKAKKYAEKIPLNNIYSSYYLDVPMQKRLIVSASFDLYLIPLFPKELVIGSSLRFKDKKVVGLEKNMYGDHKRRALKQRGINKIERLFTDSFSDKSLMDISMETALVKKGQISCYL